MKVVSSLPTVLEMFVAGRVHRIMNQNSCPVILQLCFGRVLEKGMDGTEYVFEVFVYLTTCGCTHGLVLMIMPVFVLPWLIACLVIFVLYIVLFEVMYSMVSGVIATDC